VREGGGLPRFARESRKVADWGLAVPIAFLGVAVALLVRPYLRIFLQRGVQGTLRHIADAEIYSRTVLAANYYNDGFVRRGLGGTIASTLSSDWNESTILFIIISLICFFVPILILLRRLSTALGPPQALYLAAVLGLSPQAFFGWSRDPSRTDLLRWSRGSIVGDCSRSVRSYVGCSSTRPRWFLAFPCLR